MQPLAAVFGRVRHQELLGLWGFRGWQLVETETQQASFWSVSWYPWEHPQRDPHPLSKRRDEKMFMGWKDRDKGIAMQWIYDGCVCDYYIIVKLTTVHPDWKWFSFSSSSTECHTQLMGTIHFFSHITQYTCCTVNRSYCYSCWQETCYDVPYLLSYINVIIVDAKQLRLPWTFRFRLFFLLLFDHFLISNRRNL